MSDMTPKKWRRFRGSLVIGVVIASYFLFEQGVLTSLNLGGVLILLGVFTAVGIALYWFWKKLPADSEWMQ